MNFNDYKRSLGIGGVRTNGQRHSYEAQDIIEHTWYDDPASTVGWFYDILHDDQPNENKNLHPECSKTKIPIELKYIKATYRSMEKDETDIRIMFKPSYKCNIPYYKENFEKPTDSIFPVGMYVDLKDKDGLWNRWLVCATSDATNNDFPTWAILPCDHKYQWITNGKRQEVWGVQRTQSNYTSGVWRDYKFETTDNIIKCIMPYNDITKNFYYDHRILVTVDLIEPLSWRVTKVEPLTHRGNILYTFKEDTYNQHTDYIERDDFGKIIGAWADYYKESNLPPQDDSSSSTQLDDTYAEITYAGSKPQIKVGGSYKTITIKYYSNISEVVDQTPGTWEFYINDADVSDYIKILETDNDNTIKIKFLGDEEYLGDVLVVKNTRDEVTAELKLEITSL
jgi:hypothetical protein